MLQWLLSGGTGGTTSWAWKSNSSVQIQQHSRHPRPSKAELADMRPMGGQCLSWESSEAQTGQRKMLDDSLVDFWGLGYISQDRCSMSCCIVARNDGDCDTPVHKTCLEIVFFLTLHPSRILEVWITNMEYSPGFNNASSEEYQTLA